jgi:arabinogalactan oligomer/maltooligosaccharide transport system substrate-binding protein
VRKISKEEPLRRGISTAIVAVIVVILVLAVGVGVYYYSTSIVTPTTTTAVSTVTTSTQAPVTITVWETYSPATTVNSEFGAFNKSLAAFEAAYPYITVNVETQPFGGAVAAFTTASLAGKAPDVMRLANDQIGAMVAEGFLTPISQFGNTTFFNLYQPNAINGWKYGPAGQYWGLPENLNGLALIYNKAYVTTPPTTTDQLLSMAQSITKTDSTGKIITAGFVFNYAGGLGGGYNWWPFLDGFGGSVFNASNSKQPVINSSAAVASIQWLDSLVTQYKVMPPGVDYGTADKLFTTGHAGMIINGQWDLATYEANKSISFGVAPLPTVPSTGKPLAPFLGSQGWSISAGKPTAETAAAWKFITFITNFNSQKNLVTYAEDVPSLVALASDPSVTGNPHLTGFIAQAANDVLAVNTPEMSVVYADMALTPAQPTSATSTITAAQIQSTLNTIEQKCLRDIAALG